MDFENHYKNFIKELNKKKAVDRNIRIEASYKKYLERKAKE